MRLNWFVWLCVILLVGGAVAQTNLTGAGATFPYPMYSKWFSEYHNLHPEIQINYQSIGSGGGVKQIQAGTVDFGASDGFAHSARQFQFDGVGDDERGAGGEIVASGELEVVAAR